MLRVLLHGKRCGASRDYDLMLAMVNELSGRPNIDLDNIFIVGESMGYWALCLREALGPRRNAVKAFGMHSSNRTPAANRNTA